MWHRLSNGGVGAGGLWSPGQLPPGQGPFKQKPSEGVGLSQDREKRWGRILRLRKLPVGGLESKENLGHSESFVKFSVAEGREWWEVSSKVGGWAHGGFRISILRWWARG